MSIESVIAVNRFGLGAAPGALAAAGSDPRGWLARQLGGAAPAIPEFGKLASSGEALKAYPRWIASLGTVRHGRLRPAGQRTIEGTFREQLGPAMLEEVAARLAAAVSTPAPFRERLVWFWSNHFTVSAEKALVFALAGSFEREAIRPHVGGHFGDMLLAVTRHPAMILYLDNHLSVRKGWQAQGLRASRSTAFPSPTGLNENLAREILELHTLGVNGGYTQGDVTEFARVITGWTVRPTMFDLEQSSPGFVFDPARHESGTRTLLGGTYSQEGIAQGEAVLRDLAVRPRPPCTSSHQPRPFHRRRAAARRDGASPRLPRLGRPPADRPCRPAECPGHGTTPRQVKSPIEYVVSCLRAVPALRAAQPQALCAVLRGMGQRPSSPLAARLAGPGQPGAAGTLWKRIEWAGIVAARVGSTVDRCAWRRGYGAAIGETTRAPSSVPKSPAGPGAVARQSRSSSGGRHDDASKRWDCWAALPRSLPAGLAFAAPPGASRASERHSCSCSCAVAWMDSRPCRLTATEYTARAALACRRRVRQRALDLDGRFGLSPISGDAQLFAMRELAVLRRRIAVPRALALRCAEPDRERYDQAIRRGPAGSTSRSAATRAWRRACRIRGFALGQSVRWCCVARRRSDRGRPPSWRCPTPICSTPGGAVPRRCAARPVLRGGARGTSDDGGPRGDRMGGGHCPWSSSPGRRGHSRQADGRGGHDRFRRLGHAYRPGGRVRPADTQSASARSRDGDAQNRARPAWRHTAVLSSRSSAAQWRRTAQAERIMAPRARPSSRAARYAADA